MFGNGPRRPTGWRTTARPGKADACRTSDGNRPVGSYAPLLHSRKRRMQCPHPNASDGQEQMNEKEACA
ncbi:hypothetical protein DOE73_03560 [Paenibacillus dendritiformis]|nr:hypothetical protein DOE73_03560 [Paenibacillus dendritiformis]